VYIKLKKAMLIGLVNQPSGTHLEVDDQRGKALVHQGHAIKTKEAPPIPEQDASAEDGEEVPAPETVPDSEDEEEEPTPTPSRKRRRAVMEP
jgi:hypothetical protein